MASKLKAKSDKKVKEISVKESAPYGKGLSSPFVIPGFNIDATLDSIEKKIGVTSSGMNSNEKRMSTGMLMYDLILGGGLTDGWYTNFGKEQSCKSTGAMTLLASGLMNNVPVLSYFDYEGSTEPNYVQNILKTMGVDASVEDVFGIKDKKGVYIKKPRVRYVSSSTAETFFDYVASLERALPDKIYEGDDWWYVYENTKENRKKLEESGHDYDKTLFSKYNKFYVKAEDGSLQALIIVDSYPAMLPERLAEEDANSGLGAVARMFAEQIPRVKGKMKKKRIAVVGVNQLRDRPMVRFGCFYYTAKVLLSNGKTENIGSIVNSKKPVEIMSYNEETKVFEPKRVVNWFKNGVAEPGEFLKIIVRAGSASGYNQLPCTPNHLLRDYASGKMFNASKFKVGDTLTTFAKLKELNSDQKQFLIGSLLGDGSIGRTATGAKFSFEHGAKQNDYIRWKNWLLSSYSGSLYGNSKSGLAFDTTPINDPYLLRMHKEHRSSKRTWMSREYNSTISIAFKKLDLRSLAIWYLDDGSLDKNEMRISSSGRSIEDKQLLASRIEELTGVKLYVTKRGLRCGAKDDTDKFLKAIAPYVQESMKYKLPKNLQILAGKYKWSNKLGKEKTVKVPAEIIDIVAQPMFKGMSRVKYDLEVEGNHNYIVGNCVVHNSPEYEPSGNAVRYYSDVRIKHMARAVSSVSDATQAAEGGGIEVEKSVEFEGNSDTYRYISISGDKNKKSTPFLKAFLRLWVNDGDNQARGFDPVFDTYEYLKATNQVTSGGRRSKILFKLDKVISKKPIDWLDFKTLVLGDLESIKEVCKKAGFEKPVRIRKYCFKQMSDGTGLELYGTARQNAPKEKSE